MKVLKGEVYFPIIVLIHFLFWTIDLYFYRGSFIEVSSDTLFFGELTNESWRNIHRILGEVFSSWVVTVFAFNFLMSTRAKWVERLFGGLDKMYVIHRRSGVIAVFLLIAHFIFVPRDLTEFTPGKPLGFYALVLILIGVVLSAAPIFKRKIPYHKWINIHKLMGVFYVMAVIHGLMVKSLIQELPITRVYVFGMSFIGVAAWFYRAFLFGLFNKKLEYKIDEVNSLKGGIAELTLRPIKNKLKFKAGQFAFFSFPSFNKREYHPFTISSHPNDHNIRVTIKGLGDYTNDIGEYIQIGEKALVEGPYGHFHADYIHDREQVWIAGGIGITPFLSLAKDSLNNRIDLFWCVNSKEDAVYENELKEIANSNSNFNVIIWNSNEKGHLTAEKLGIDEYKEKGYLLCGPRSLKESITKGLKVRGVNPKNIYEEEFAFR